MPPPDRKRELAQFFTPPQVATLAWDLLTCFGATPDNALIADPACGAGVWLAEARRRGAPRELHGCDLDERQTAAWLRSGLSADEACALGVSDGLLLDAAPPGFDVVTGNPPFGITLDGCDPDHLARVAARHHLYLGAAGSRTPPLNPTPGDLDRLRRFPLELLFLERFVALCRPGGWIAIILPEGIAANARWRYVREWLLTGRAMHAVIALPRGTFGAHGTQASTCLMILRNAPAAANHQAILTGLDSCTPAACDELVSRVTADAFPPASAADLPAGLLPPPLMR